MSLENYTFEEIKRDLVDHFKSDPKYDFTDWDFAGSNLNALMDLLAYNTHNNAVIANFNTSESFIDTAQLRSSSTKLARLVGYTPRSATASQLRIWGAFTLRPGTNTTEGGASIQRGSVFNVNDDTTGKTAAFTVLDSAPLVENTANGTHYTTTVDTPIVAYEGTLVDEVYTYNEGSNKFVISSHDVDISTIRVSSKPNTTDAAPTVYKAANSLVDIDKKMPVFYITENLDGFYEVSFGSGGVGQTPSVNDIIKINYLETHGFSLEGVTGEVSYSPAPGADINASVFLTTNGERSTGGNSRETIEELKANATSSVVIQNRAVTSADYSTMLTEKFPFLSSVSVWGGEDNYPPQYGKVFIATNPKEARDTVTFRNSPAQLTPIQHEAIQNFLATKKVLAIQPELVKTKYAFIIVDVGVQYDDALTELSAGEVSALIAKNTEKYNEEVLSQFGSEFYTSKYVDYIQRVMPYIDSINTRVYATQTNRIRRSDAMVTYVYDFGVPITAENNKILKRVIALGDNGWTHNGKPATLQERYEMGVSKVDFTVSTERGTQVVAEVGEFDRVNSTLKISGVFADSDVDVSIIVPTLYNDFTSTRNKLLNIDTSKSSITAVPSSRVSDTHLRSFKKSRE